MSLSLKFNLLNVSNLEDINKLCGSNRELCIKNREILCRKTLEISGYKVHVKYNACQLFKDLLSFARKAKNSIYKGTNILVITPNLISVIAKADGYVELKRFMNDNIKNKEDKIPEITNQNRTRRLTTPSLNELIKDLSTVKM